MTPFFITILSFLCIVSVVQLIILYNHTRRKWFKSSKYINLRYQFNYALATATIGGALLVFLGYNSAENLKKSFEGDLRSSNLDLISRAERLENRIRDLELELLRKADQLDEAQNESDMRLQTLNSQYNQLDRINQNSSARITSISDELSSLDELDFLKGFYHVPYLELSFDRQSQQLKDTVYFSSLITSSGGRLPSFRAEPTIFLSSTVGHEAALGEVTKDYFIVYAGADRSSNQSGLNNQSNIRVFRFKISLLIVED